MNPALERPVDHLVAEQAGPVLLRALDDPRRPALARADAAWPHGEVGLRTRFQHVGIGLAVRPARGLHPEIHEARRQRLQPVERRVEPPDVVERCAHVGLTLERGHAFTESRGTQNPAVGTRRFTALVIVLTVRPKAVLIYPWAMIRQV
jgi:hypothetical protein